MNSNGYCERRSASRCTVWTTIVVFGLMCITSMHAQNQEDPSNTVIAKVGNSYITEKEFVERFELLPAFGRQRRSQLESAKEEFAYELIAEKILAQEAKERHFDQDSNFQRAYVSIKKKIARDELYRVEVSNKVTVSEREINEGISQILRQIFVSYLYFKNKTDADFIRGQMKKSTDFELLTIDSSVAYLRDTATVIWGDAESTLQNVVYAMKKGEISSVVPTSQGYYIVKVLKIEPNNYYRSMQPAVLRDNVREIIRLKKEHIRMNDYVSSTLRSKKSFAHPKLFSLLAHSLAHAYRSKVPQDSMLFSPAVMQMARRECANELVDTLIIVGNTAWTLNDVIGKLENRESEPPESDSTWIPRSINAALNVLVQQELLEQEALRRGMDQDPAIKEKLTVWKDAMLAADMEASIRRKCSVTDADVYSYLNQKKIHVNIPRVNVRMLVTKNSDEMKQAMMEIHQEDDFVNTIRHRSIDSTKRRDGMTGFFPITEREPIGTIAWQMKPGQLYGPLRYGHNVVLFQLVAKDSTAASVDSTAERDFAKAKDELLKMEEKRMINLFLAEKGEQRGFIVYTDRLKKIKVTPLPMMTFRILGFGGRMFEMPFVNPLLDWLNIDTTNTSKVLP